MNQQVQAKKVVAIAHRLNGLLHEASRVSVATLKLKEGAGRDVICTIAIAEALANQVTQTALAGLAAIGMSPEIPNGMTDQEIVAAFERATSQATAKLRLFLGTAAIACLSETLEPVGAALLTQAEELAGLARQAMFRAGFFVTSAEIKRQVQ